MTALSKKYHNTHTHKWNTIQSPRSIIMPIENHGQPLRRITSAVAHLYAQSPLNWLTTSLTFIIKTSTYVDYCFIISPQKLRISTTHTHHCSQCSYLSSRQQKIFLHDFSYQESSHNDSHLFPQRFQTGNVLKFILWLSFAALIMMQMSPQ